METFWATIAGVVPVVALFGVWMIMLVKQIGKTQTSELSRIEQKVDLLRDAQTTDVANLSKMVDVQFSHVHEKLALMHEQQEKWFTNHPGY